LYFEHISSIFDSALSKTLCKVKLSNEAKLKEENELLKNELNNFKNDMMEMQKQLINVLNQNKIHPGSKEPRGF
jgi:hypothetical protein